MKDYMGLYNERFTKQAPRFNNAYQARTYQDYIRNIQNQRAAAGQTFGGLNAQAQNQSFYDRAMGTPPGLTGGMQQQFSNQMSAARARQLGETAQQRYQAFADLSNQELQASQFARAEAASEQQFQTQNIAFKQQQKQYAKQIMDSNASEDVKAAQLREIGMTEGEIEAAGPQPGGAIIGGGLQAAFGVPTAVGITRFAQFEKNLMATQNLVGTGADTAFTFADGKYTLAEGIAKPTNKDLAALYDDALQAVDKVNNPGNATGELLEGLQTNAKDKIKAFKDAQGKYVDDVLDGSVKMKEKLFAKSTTLKTTASGTASNTGTTAVASLSDDAVGAGIKGVVKGKTEAAIKGVKVAAKSKILGGKALAFGKAKTMLAAIATGPVGAIVAAYLIAEVGSQILTGTGLTKGIINILNNKDYSAGTKGLINVGS